MESWICCLPSFRNVYDNYDKRGEEISENVSSKNTILSEFLNWSKLALPLFDKTSEQINETISICALFCQVLTDQINSSNQGSEICNLTISAFELIAELDTYIQNWAKTMFEKINGQVLRYVSYPEFGYTLHYFITWNRSYLFPTDSFNIPKELQLISTKLKTPGTQIFYSSSSYFSESCVICDDAQSEHVIIPCGHVCLCNDCSLQHSINLKGCPLCNSEIRQITDYQKFGYRRE